MRLAGGQSRGIAVVAFAAWSGTGKTTVLEGVIRHLAGQGLRVAVLKHDAHGLDLDRKGKDTWRFDRAGAAITAASGPGGSVVMERREWPLLEALGHIRNVDLILVEGYKDVPLTQIGLCRAATGKGFTAPLERFAAIVTDLEEIQASVPVFAFQDTDKIAGFLLNNLNNFTHFYNGAIEEKTAL